jgi:hypothetical protein
LIRSRRARGGSWRASRGVRRRAGRRRRPRGVRAASGTRACRTRRCVRAARCRRLPETLWYRSFRFLPDQNSCSKASLRRAPWTADQLGEDHRPAGQRHEQQCRPSPAAPRNWRAGSARRWKDLGSWGLMLSNERSGMRQGRKVAGADAADADLAFAQQRVAAQRLLAHDMLARPSGLRLDRDGQQVIELGRAQVRSAGWWRRRRT